MGLSDDELAEPEPFSEVQSLSCPICRLVLVDPVAGKCGHCFCRICIERVIVSRTTPRCPVCRADMAMKELRTSSPLKQRADSVRVCCLSKCGWIGRLDERAAHMVVCPVASATEFVVSVDKFADSPDWKLGLDVSMHDGTNLVVTRVKFGAIDSYNVDMQSRPDLQVRPGDAIVAVDGVRGDVHQLCHVLKHRTECTGGTLELVLRHPTLITAEIEKGSRPLGLGLSYIPAACSLLVLDFEDGAVNEYNASNAGSAAAIRKLDHIVEVNGCSGEPMELLRAIRESSVCCLAIHRYE